MLHRFAYDLHIYDTAVAELTGIARIERRDHNRWRITSIVLDGLRGRSMVLPHCHRLHAEIAAWLCRERRDEIEETMRRHDAARRLMRAS